MGGAASGALVSMLMHPKARKKLGKTAIKVGGMAAVAGVGYLGYKQWQKSRGNGSAPAPGAVERTTAAALEASDSEFEVSASLGEKLLLAMISAAAADGKIDNLEMNTLLEEASELYAASIEAIDPDTPAEHLYLRRLRVPCIWRVHWCSRFTLLLERKLVGSSQAIWLVQRSYS